MASPADATRLARTAVHDLEAATTLDKRIDAAEALGALARAGHGREVLQAGGARPLLALLASPSGEVLAAATEALGSMCNCGDDVRVQIAAAGAGEAIGAALEQQPLSPQRWKLLGDLLLNIMIRLGGGSAPEHHRQLVLGLLHHPGCLEQLMRVAEGSGAGHQLQDPHGTATVALWLVASLDPAAVATLRPSLAAFVQLLASVPSGTARSFAPRLLGALTDRAELRPRLAAAGAVAALVQAMQQAPTNTMVQYAASRALGSLAEDCGVARQATDAGAAQALVAALRAFQPPPPASLEAWSADSASVSSVAAVALGALVTSDSRAAVQAVEAGAAPLLALLLRPPSRQTLARAQREGWALVLDDLMGEACWPTERLCDCWSSSGAYAHADAARRALRAAGMVKLLTERLRACPAGDGSAWARTAGPLAAMIEVGNASGGAASAGQPQPRLLGQEDEVALELLVQGLHANDRERQARAAAALALLLMRSRSGEVAAHLAQRGVLGQARQLAASSAAGDEQLRSVLLALGRMLEEPEVLQGLEERWRQQQEGLRARAAGAEPAGPSGGVGGSSARRAEGAAAAVSGAASSGDVCACCGAAKASGSAKLRRCAGCLAVRYCSPACQKAHWREHRAACKAAQGAK
jgi:hypothetical protein